jgi:hypothetical protein
VQNNGSIVSCIIIISATVEVPAKHRVGCAKRMSTEVPAKHRVGMQNIIIISAKHKARSVTTVEVPNQA